MRPSQLNMEAQTEKTRQTEPQLISVAHNDTIRLLEVYVKRSLSLNDGTLRVKQPEGKQKWVTMPKKHRRHSSDPSLHLAEELKDETIDTFTPTAIEPDIPEVAEKLTKKNQKNKKPTLWKRFLGLFSRKHNEAKEEEQESTPEIQQSLPSGLVTLQKRKSLRRKSSIRKRFSKRGPSLNRPLKDQNPGDITTVESVVSVEPTYSYYEKVSEELEKILHEVKDKEEVETLTDEEIINRIIALTKEQGDAIEDKLKESSTLSNFFQRMSYSSFQSLADAYLEKEASPTLNPPTVLPTALELVKLAFTLDFTARIAVLSRQNIGHITGLGNRYLQDRFEYKQACTDHPWSDSDD